MLSANLLVCDCICGPSLSLPKSTWNRGWKPFWITQKNSADCSETKEVQATCPLSHHESAAGTTRWLWVFDHRPISSSHPTSSICHSSSFLTIAEVKQATSFCLISALGGTGNVWKLQNYSVRWRITAWATILVTWKQATQEQEHYNLNSNFTLPFAFLSSPHVCFFLLHEMITK